MDDAVSRAEALASPGATNSAIAAALEGAGVNQAPVVEDPPSDQVRLPGGLVRGDEVIRTVTVRELDGSDEEALSRALKGSIFQFMDVLIERGTVAVGDIPASRELLKSLLIGDRDEIALGIRTMTYGDNMEIERWICPACGNQSDISFTLTEDVLDRRRLENPAEETTFEVRLRKGGKVLVRLPTGADQDALFKQEDWTTAQRNTILISRCVMTYTDADGQNFNMAAFPSMSLRLSIPDRQKIIREISERQPGPRYNEVRFVHDECKNEVILALGVRDLFRDLLLFL